jgi:hypothetical protein
MSAAIRFHPKSLHADLLAAGISVIEIFGFGGEQIKTMIIHNNWFRFTCLTGKVADTGVKEEQ